MTMPLGFGRASGVLDIRLFMLMHILLSRRNEKRDFPFLEKSLVGVVYSVRSSQPVTAPHIYYAGNRKKQANGMTGRFQKT
jgi:hypothetical protein